MSVQKLNEIYKEMYRSGFPFTVNEMRKAEGLPPLDAEKEVIPLPPETEELEWDL